MKASTVISIIFVNIKIWLLKLLGQSHKIVPYKALINLTDLCNSRCQYCEIWKIKPVNEINLNDIKIEDFINFIIKKKLYVNDKFISNNLNTFIELFFYKNVNYYKKISYKFKEYFYLKLSRVKKYNLDLESFFLEFKEELLSE